MISDLRIGPRCDGCGFPVDLSVCWCGATLVQHRPSENHGFIPMGCECHRDRSRAGQSLPDFPGDGPDEIRTVCAPPPCFCCGRYHEFDLTFEEARQILLAPRDVESTRRYAPPTPSGDSR